MLSTLTRATGAEGSAVTETYRVELKRYEKKPVRSVLKSTGENQLTSTLNRSGTLRRGRRTGFESDEQCDQFVRDTFPETVQTVTSGGG